jgi:hypothetical protein
LKKIDFVIADVFVCRCKHTGDVLVGDIFFIEFGFEDILFQFRKFLSIHSFLMQTLLVKGGQSLPLLTHHILDFVEFALVSLSELVHHILDAVVEQVFLIA